MRKNYPADFKAKIVLEILREEKSLSQISSEYGIHTTQLNRWKKHALENLPQLFADESKGLDAMKNGYEKQLQDLYAEVGRLTTQLNWLKKNLASELTRNDRLALIDWESTEVPIKTQAELLSINRSPVCIISRCSRHRRKLLLKTALTRFIQNTPFTGHDG